MYNYGNTPYFSKDPIMNDKPRDTQQKPAPPQPPPAISHERPVPRPLYTGIKAEEIDIPMPEPQRPPVPKK
jgi:hypothetical protein